MDEQIEQGKPFFTYLALNTPHSPYHPKAKDYAIYKDQIEDQRVAKFYALIHNIDENYARLERWLRKRKIRDDTFIVFMNDNGSSAGAKLYNAEMRGKKGSEYEGGHRAMCFIRWPNGGFGNPRTLSGNAHVTDILPTLVDLLNLRTYADFDGASLAKSLRDESAELKGRKIIVQYGGRHRPEANAKSVVMLDAWRLVNGRELYNIKEDPRQTVDVAYQYPELAESLQIHYDRFWDAIELSNQIVEPIFVGHSHEPFTELTCVSWVEVDCDNRDRVATATTAGEREPAFGGWRIHALAAGTYRIQLSRWPFHLARKLNLPGPAYSIGGDKLEQGKALPIALGKLVIDGKQTTVAKPTAKGTMIEMIVELEEGTSTMEGWFEDESGNKLSGAFYGRVAKL